MSQRKPDVRRGFGHTELLNGLGANGDERLIGDIKNADRTAINREIADAQFEDSSVENIKIIMDAFKARRVRRAEVH